MKIHNTHHRVIAASAAQVGQLLDTLGSAQDQVWPIPQWPAVKLDRPLQVGATGGHGPIRYHVSEYEPGRRIRFQFEPDWNGYHECKITALGPHQCQLSHVIAADPGWSFSLRWLALIRPMHDALIEDLFDRVESHFAPVAQPQFWSAGVRLGRWMMGA